MPNPFEETPLEVHRKKRRRRNWMLIGAIVIFIGVIQVTTPHGRPDAHLLDQTDPLVIGELKRGADDSGLALQ